MASGEEEVTKPARFDFIFKIVLVGDATSGKTSLIRRYVEESFSSSTLTTIGVDFKLKTVVTENQKIKLQIWDTAGQERFASLGQMYYRGAHAFLVAYDISNKSTFNNIPRWINRITDQNSLDPETMLVLVGCKSDLAMRQVTSETAQIAAIQSSARHRETSAATGEGVDQLFSDIAIELLHRKIGFTRNNSNNSNNSSNSNGSVLIRSEKSSDNSTVTKRRSSFHNRFFKRSSRRSVIRLGSEPDNGLIETNNKCCQII